ncbi:MAG TPA: hypothetical protein VGG34_12565 [Opitutaceae bacterium]|jgi:hypothetical protein
MGLRRTALAASIAGLLAIGYLVASPLICKELVGTGESFNYSLSLADSLKQMRAGVMPPLAGQSEYAYNGRIHPLRTAPYLYFLGAAIDDLTSHRLPVWQVQNASLVFSIIMGGLMCFLGLRWGTQCPVLLSFLLSAAYACAPPLLGAAYTLDLYMTVHAAMFAPLVAGACMRSATKPSFSADAWLAAALAAAWLAHPPVALWLTAGSVLVRLAAFAVRPRVQAAVRGVFALALAAALSAYVFASAHTLDTGTQVLSSKDVGRGIPELLMATLKGTFPASIHPIDRAASAQGAMQFGYIGWLVLGLTIFCLLGRRKLFGRVEAAAAWAAAIFSGLLLTMTLPVPMVTYWLWRHVPGAVLELTTIWPAQRLLLVALLFTLFAASIALPRWIASTKLSRTSIAVVIVLAAGWSWYQATAYVQRGIRDRRPSGETEALYRPSNLDLTITSYAYVQTPTSYVAGVDDPTFKFRLLQNGTKPILSNLEVAQNSGTVVAHDVLRGYHTVNFTLEPGKRYLATFNFLMPLDQGYLIFRGPILRREYHLPSAGGPEGFGMLPGQSRSIPLWTDGSSPEAVALSVASAALNSDMGADAPFAEVSLREVDLDRLPVHLSNLIPMRFEVNAPQGGLTVETPRRYIPGYQAIVNGVPCTAIQSPDGNVMVPVPTGRSTIELECIGPHYLVVAFWVSASSWLLFLLWRLTGSWVPVNVPIAAASFARFSGRHWATSAFAVAIVAAAIICAVWYRRRERYLKAVGPLAIDFRLPYGMPGKSQPLLTTGIFGAAAVIYVHMVDERHILFGVDVWGTLTLTPPIELDYSRIHTLVVSDSALFPTGHPALAHLSKDELAKLRNQMCIELDGQEIFQKSLFAYDTTPAQVLVGTTPFASNTDPTFYGQILRVRRLPVPRAITTPGSRHVELDAKFPSDRTRRTEPIAVVTVGDQSVECYVTYLPEYRLAFSEWAPGRGVMDTSDAVDYDPRIAHEIGLIPGLTDDRALRLDVALTIDGTRVIGGRRVHALESPTTIVTGLNTIGAPDVERRFTGRRLSPFVRSNGSEEEPLHNDGPLHMIVTFPKNKTGVHEPLLTTGRTGAGDLIFVSYLDGSHIQIGFDHWGVGGASSPPISVDYGIPHEIWIATPSLGSDASAGNKTTVIFDGRPVLSSSYAAYPTTPEEITILTNRIGASTASADFSGDLKFSERIGSEPLPATR